MSVDFDIQVGNLNIMRMSDGSGDRHGYQASDSNGTTVGTIELNYGDSMDHPDGWTITSLIVIAKDALERLGDAGHADVTAHLGSAIGILTGTVQPDATAPQADGVNLTIGWFDDAAKQAGDSADRLREEGKVEHADTFLTVKANLETIARNLRKLE